jgi:hypothetical protein
MVSIDDPTLNGKAPMRPRKRGSKSKPGIPTSSPSRSLAEEAYKVGPGRPPKEHQFKPGQSGNPKGAKLKTPSLTPELKELFARAFRRKVKVTQGEREGLITMWEAGMQQLSIQFAKGDRDARRDAFWLAEKLAPELLTSKASNEILAGDYQAILDAYVARQAAQTGSCAPCPVLAPPGLLDDDTPDGADET